ncbi:MAG TPA: amino acid ABC transporter ATP-binding protein [Peptococcaceae bacterium]|jgi:polar amino acid transport system ATP-binding protein|nr:amino acid ABC transporter ATP-binding protein [Clostridia bacterium]HOB81685.1 amino acid ABC transporter ATP-binding protein [Peptococcaceae bacterium]HPZ71373.1 amino acid ABC transporter ATP-binding protein [Peptococcaceae bacterium]HQD54366.1 amino acid ABC transporter ATP-binding protein [Peptococcaceae bacterium]
MVLKVEGLWKSFKTEQVLKDVGFSLQTGEILAIIGRSGSGKTTLLRCINNLVKCDRGSIMVDGIYLCRQVTDANGTKCVYAKGPEQLQIRKRLGMVFQSFNLFPHMSVLENIIEAPVRVFRVPRPEAEEKARRLLAMLELQDKEAAYPFELSGGQKQRVAIARACALNPLVMCLDEPTSALDPELREGIAQTIENLAAQGMGVLLITHDMVFAKRVAHRVIFMEEGEILAEGSKEEFFADINNERIKSFIAG